MKIKIESILHKKLVIVKQIYQNAVILSGSVHNINNSIFAVIGFDLAVEMLLRTTVGFLDSSRTPADGFQGLINQVEKLLEKSGSNSLPDKVNIQHIHSIRNDVQHKAKFPNLTDVNDCRT